MFKCFKCNGQLLSSDNYITHLKNVHMMKSAYNENEIDVYKCTADNCTQQFKKIFCFKRHIILHEIKDSKIPTKSNVSLKQILN